MAAQIVIPVGAEDRANEVVPVDRATALDVARIESRDGQLGMLVGLVVVVLGALLIVMGLGAAESSTWDIKFGSFEMTLTTAVPGIFFAVVGFLVVFITRPKVVFGVAS